MENKELNDNGIELLRSRWDTSEGRKLIDVILRQSFFLSKYKLTEVVNDETLERDLFGINLSSRVLSDAMLYDMDLRWADFQGAQFNIGSVSQSDLTCANFKRVTLNEIIFWESKLIDVTFSEATLSKVIFGRCEVRKTCFDGAVLDQVQLNSLDLTDIDFSMADFRKCTMNDVKLNAKDRDFWEGLGDEKCWLRYKVEWC